MLFHVRMAPRDPDEPHRTATPLELLLDLAFVVAVAQAADSLHHGLVDGHAGNALVSFPLVFFAIFWAWVNIAWFGSAYDNDDVVYRMAVFVQMTGVLVLAAGVPRAFDDRDFTGRGGRVRRDAPGAGRRSGCGWRRRSRRVGAPRCATPSASPRCRSAGSFVWPNPRAGPCPPSSCLPPPRWPCRSGPKRPVAPRGTRGTSWSATACSRSSSWVSRCCRPPSPSRWRSTTTAPSATSAPVVIGGLLIVFSMWWIYFDLPSEHLVERARGSSRCTAPPPSSGATGTTSCSARWRRPAPALAVAIDQAIGHSELSDVQAGLAAHRAIALYVVTVWALHYREKAPGSVPRGRAADRRRLVLASSLTPEPVLVSGLVLAGIVALSVVMSPERSATGADGPEPASPDSGAEAGASV